jgi:16S rRNA C1402 (ribose-2'-O) methylase RsmI
MRVRSIGGASVLGTALMRVGCVVNDFTFFGRITPDRAEADLLSKLRALGTLRQAWIWFSDADALHGTLDTLGREAARVHAGIAVLADLTMPSESVAVWLPGEQPAPPLAGSRFVVMLLTRGQVLQIVDR